MPFATFRFLDNRHSRAKFQREVEQIRGHAKAVLEAEEVCLFVHPNQASAASFVSSGGSAHLPSSALSEFQDAAHAAMRAAAAARQGAVYEAGHGGEGNLPALGQFIGEPIRDGRGKIAGAIVAKRSRPWEARDAVIIRLISRSITTIANLCRAEFDLRGCLDREHLSHQTIKDAEERFSALARNVPGAIFRYVRMPSGSEQIQYMSPGCTGIWGYAPEEMERDPQLLWNAVLPEDREALRASLQRSQDDLVPWQHRWRVRHKLGFLKWLQAYGTPYRTDADGVAWNTLILDVTVEQDAQLALAENTRQLHEAQKLESIGRLAGGVAHDFNNLLAVIVGNAEVIAASGGAGDQAESLNEIVEASHRGATLVKHLLSFARKSDLRATVADVRDVLFTVETMLRRVLPANISLEVVQRAGLWPVQIDRAMFESALLNIVINARDAMPEGGAITIETSNERVDHDYIISRDEDIKPGRYVMVAVTDTGGGIDEAALPFVFEPFFSTRSLGEGPGLGLAMVQGFVKQSRGVVRIYSEPGRGTSLKMYFPALDQDALSEQRSGPSMPALGNASATVLLVEDQEGVRRVIEKAIASAGYKVIAASSGDEAIELYQDRHHDIDVLVTDVVMPGKIQGPQLVRLARKINQNLPVLYMSGYPHEANVHGNGIRAGDISLMKPIRRTDLLTALEKVLRHQ